MRKHAQIIGHRNGFVPNVRAEPTDSLVSSLFAATNFQDIAELAVQRAEACFGCRNARMVWKVGAIADGQPIRKYWPAGTLTDYESALIDAALEQSQDSHFLTTAIEAQHPGASKIVSSLITAQAVLLADAPHPSDSQAEAPPGWSDFIILVGSALEKVEQGLLIQRLDKSAHLQSALYSISELASGELDMPEMLRNIHSVVGKLMYARNFFIALYHAERNSLRFIYYADETDQRKINPDEEFPADQLRNSLTLAVIRQGKPALGPSAALRAKFGLQFDTDYGPESADWLGVPMVAGGESRGAVVVQSYEQAGRYSEEDRALLAFVAQHILTAMERKQAFEALEQRVAVRTRELTAEVRERQRGEKLQAALYSIADLASSELPMGEMLPRIHEVVGELMYARNFIIGLYNAVRDTMRFIYVADEHDESTGIYKMNVDIPSEKLGNSATLAVIRNCRSAMGPLHDVLEMLGMSLGQPMGTAAEDWLGVPMISDGAALGAVVVQTYDPSVHYTEEDRALLAYVAQHILTALARKQAQAELESRVEERTRELREQIIERKRIEEQLRFDTMHDNLTGLYNRSYFFSELERALAKFNRDSLHTFAVIFLDLDRFKIINDSVGHFVGDEILKEASRRIATCVRSPDVVARLGGDEFAMLLTDTHGLEGTCHVAQRLIDSLSKPMRVAGKELFTSASVGIAFSHARYHSPEELLRDADVAMYRAKEHGRRQFSIFDERLHQQALDLLEIEGDLQRAIQRSEFEPHFQPIVRLHDRQVVGYEALLRWRHPQRGLLLPEAFLSVAEENGSIEEIDWQMFEKTCRDFSTLGNKGTYVTINVSPRHFRSASLANQLLEILSTHNLSAHKLRLELTEGAMFEDPDQVLATLQTLHKAGVFAVLDDFGTGYSSLSYLHRFPLHTLKIDKSFVNALHRGSAVVVHAVIALATTLGIEVVAEGVETQAQCDHLLEMGCIYGQGYLFSHARPASEWAAVETEG